MFCNVNKWKLRSFGTRNSDYKSALSLFCVVKEDLDVIVPRDVKYSKQYTFTNKKGNMIF